MDYSKYKMSFKEKALVIMVSIFATFVIAYLFYDSMWGIIFAPLFIAILSRLYRNSKIKEQKDRLTREFIDFLKNVSTALIAGYSIENAWVEAQKELGLLHGTKSLMYKEVSEMNRAVTINVPIEAVLEKFALRTEVDDIISFVELFSFAKRSGGDFVGIIDSTTNRICQKYETYREIEVSLASKRMEQKIMNGIPIFILAYLRLTSADYMQVLYGNIMGITFMTVCLVMYGGAIFLSEKIINISV